MTRQSKLGLFALFMATLVWGASFSFQKKSIEFLSPLHFNGIRFWMGALFLIPVTFLSDWRQKKPLSWMGEEKNPFQARRWIWGGIWLGILLGVASLLQHCGMIYASAGKAAFISALYILFVPVLGLCVGKKIGLLQWFSVLLGLGGTYFLCNTLEGNVNLGDILLLLSAVSYGLLILLASFFAPETDCLRLSIVEFFVSGVVSFIAGVLLEHPLPWEGVCKTMGALLYCGIFSTGIGYTLQNIGQKYVHEVTASLIMCLEAVFSLIFSWLFIGERMSARELSGCLIIFWAFLISQLAPQPSPNSNSKSN